jgi:hypothetical protein
MRRISLGGRQGQGITREDAQAQLRNAETISTQIGQ